MIFIVVCDSDSSSEENTTPQISPLEFAELMDVEYGVEEYFEIEELEQMSPVELKRYKNLRANYEVMKAMGKGLVIYLIAQEVHDRHRPSQVYVMHPVGVSQETF